MIRNEYMAWYVTNQLGENIILVIAGNSSNWVLHFV